MMNINVEKWGCNILVTSSSYESAIDFLNECEVTYENDTITQITTPAHHTDTTLKEVRPIVAKIMSPVNEEQDSEAGSHECNTWPASHVELLLTACFKRRIDKCDLRGGKMGSKWHQVQRDLEAKGIKMTVQQCKNKFNAEKRKYLKFKNPQSGSARIKCEFSNLFNEYMGETALVRPKFLLSQDGCITEDATKKSSADHLSINEVHNDAVTTKKRKAVTSIRGN